MSKIDLAVTKLEKALISLEDIYMKPPTADRATIDATIQRFEFTFELFWKLLKLFLNEKGVEVQFPKDVLQEAYKASILNDEILWLGMLKDRNLTSHTYDKILADEIFARIQAYVPVLRNTYDRFMPMISSLNA